MLHLIDVWLLDICNTLGGCLAQLILQRLLGAFQVVLLQEGKNSLQEVKLKVIQIIHYNCEKPALWRIPPAVHFPPPLAPP